MSTNVNKNSLSMCKDALSLIIKVVIRLVSQSYPSGIAAGYYLSLLSALHELKAAEDFLNDVDL